MLAGVLLLVAFGSVARANVALHSLFTHNMVVQRDEPLRVFGNAEPGENVTVTLAGRSTAATAGADGRWDALLDPMAAGGPFELNVRGRNAITLTNVLAGDVWLCAGHANMAVPTGQARDPLGFVDADWHRLRLFRVQGSRQAVPQDDCGGAWTPCDADAAAAYPAVPFFFGAHLQRVIGVPVGLIASACADTSDEEWLPRAAYEMTAPGREFLADWDAALATNAARWAAYSRALAQWQASSASLSDRPRPPGERAPMTRYNGWIHPLARFAIKGIAWYPDGPAMPPAPARDVLPALVDGYRSLWGKPDMPFLIVQLPNYGHPDQRSPVPEHAPWPLLREAQFQTAGRLPCTGLTVTIDIGGPRHPGRKDIVGQRLATAALGVAYGRTDLVTSGPVFMAAAAESNAVRVTFAHAGGGLMARDPETGEVDGPMRGFAVAGSNGLFCAAEALIRSNTVVVSSAAVPRPVAVRYAFHRNPQCDLYNREGLPASPFRTDAWPAPPAQEQPKTH